MTTNLICLCASAKHLKGPKGCRIPEQTGLADVLLSKAPNPKIVLTVAVFTLSSPVSEPVLTPVTLRIEGLAYKRPLFIPLCKSGEYSTEKRAKRQHNRGRVQKITRVNPSTPIIMSSWFALILRLGVGTGGYCVLPTTSAHGQFYCSLYSV